MSFENIDPLQDGLTRWTVRLAVCGYLARVLIDVSKSRSDLVQAWKRAIWSAAFVSFVLHVIFAFSFYHHWSHAHAYAHTAQQTMNVTGIDWGGGLFFNYLFMAVWMADVIVSWRANDFWRQSNRYQCGIHWMFAFMMLNATVVFGPTHWLWIGIAFVLIFVPLMARKRAAAQ